MPDSTSEQVLKALFAALGARMPVGATLVRNETLPSRIPAGGWVCLRDGNPGDPDFLFRPRPMSTSMRPRSMLSLTAQGLRFAIRYSTRSSRPLARLFPPTGRLAAFATM